MEYLDIAYKVVISSIGIFSALLLIVGLFRGWWKIFKNIKKAIYKLDLFLNRCNHLFDNFLPEIFQSLEKKGIMKDGSISEWTKFVSSQATESYKSDSPLTITEGGRGILNAVNFDTVFETHKANIFNRLREKINQRFLQPVKYDVELMSIDLVLESFDNPEFSFARNYLYHHPNFSKRELTTLVGLAIRDKYLEEHQEIE